MPDFKTLRITKTLPQRSDLESESEAIERFVRLHVTLKEGFKFAETYRAREGGDVWKVVISECPNEIQVTITHDGPPNLPPVIPAVADPKPAKPEQLG